MGYNHTLVVSKLNDIHMKNKHEEILRDFWTNIQNAEGEEFGSKMSGYCLIYAPYMVCMLESDDSDYHMFVL